MTRQRRPAGRPRMFWVVAALISALLLISGAPAAQALIGDPVVTGTAAGETSVAGTAGKARGSGLWGYVGDIETRLPGATGRSATVFSHGVGINPVDGSVWVTDSARLCHGTWGWLSCPGERAKNGATYLSGVPRVYRYALESDDWAAGNYLNDGSYGAVPAGANAGIGVNWQAVADRTTIETGSTGAFGGPRGIAFTTAGQAWVLDGDHTSPFLTDGADARHAVRIFDPGGTEADSFGQADWPTGDALSNRHHPLSFDHPVALARMANGNMIITSQAAELLKEYRPDGTFVRNIHLRQDEGAAFAGDPGIRGPHAIAVDPTDGSLLVGYLDPGSGNPGYIERIDPNDCRTEPADLPAGSARERCKVLDVIGLGDLATGTGADSSPAVTFQIAVDPLTGDIHLAQRDGRSHVFSSDGSFQGRFSGFGTGVADGQAGVSVRGIAFDERGYIFVTVAEGSANTRVQIFARTPDPITGATATYTDATRTAATVSWDGLPTDSTAQGKTVLRDYTVEVRESSDGGTTWSAWALAPKAAASTGTTRTLQGLDPDRQYQARIAGWNEAGNGDTAVAPVGLPPSTLRVVISGNDIDTPARADAVQVGAGTSVDFSYTVTNDGPSPVTDLRLTDSELGTIGAPDGFDGSLAANESVTFTASGQIPAGPFQNTATVTAGSAGEQVSDSDTWYGFGVTGGLTIVKTGNGAITATAADAVRVGAGSDVVFNYTVTNTGNLPVKDLVVVDDLLGTISAPAGFDGTLAADGGMVTFSATGPIGAGAYTSTAVASGSSAGQPVSAETRWHGLGVESGLAVVKTGNGVANDSAGAPLYVAAGTVVSFEYTIHNGSDAPVTIDSVHDSVLGAITAPAGFGGTLAAGSSVTFTASGPVATGSYHGVVVVQATAEQGTELRADDDWYGFGTDTGLTVTRTGNGQHPDAGDPLAVLSGTPADFAYTIHNTSNVPVRIGSVVDDGIGVASATADFDGTLAPGAAVEYIASAAIEAGAHTNTVRVSGTAADGSPLRASDDWQCFGVSTAVSVSATGDGVVAGSAEQAHRVATGRSVGFRYTIANHGNTPVRLDEVLDSLPGDLAAPEGFDGVLEPGATVTYLATGTLPEGAYHNEVSVRATETLTATVLAASDSWYGHGENASVADPGTRPPGDQDPGMTYPDSPGGEAGSFPDGTGRPSADPGRPLPRTGGELAEMFGGAGTLTLLLGLLAVRSRRAGANNRG